MKGLTIEGLLTGLAIPLITQFNAQAVSSTLHKSGADVILEMPHFLTPGRINDVEMVPPPDH